MPDQRDSTHAAPIQSHGGPARQCRYVIPARGIPRPSATQEVETNDPEGSGQPWDHRFPTEHGQGSITEQEHDGRVRLTVLDDAELTIVKRTELLDSHDGIIAWRHLVVLYKCSLLSPAAE
jgi:hypothetical protein